MLTGNTYPPNHELGAEVLLGNKGTAKRKYRLGNLLLGRNPNADTSALTLMCVARCNQLVLLQLNRNEGWGRGTVAAASK